MSSVTTARPLARTCSTMRAADGNGMAATWTTGVRPCCPVHSAGRSSGRGATSRLRSGGVLYTQLLRPSCSYTTQLRTVGPAIRRSPRVSTPASRKPVERRRREVGADPGHHSYGHPPDPCARGGVEGVAPWRSHRGLAVGVHDVIDRQVADDDDVGAGAFPPARLGLNPCPVSLIVGDRFAHCPGPRSVAPEDGKCRIRSSRR